MHVLIDDGPSGAETCCEIKLLLSIYSYVLMVSILYLSRITICHLIKVKI